MSAQCASSNLTVSEPTRSRLWRQKDGLIYLSSVTSDGTTGKEWIERLEKKGFRVGKYAERALRSADFRPTSGITTEIAVLPGWLFEDDDRITSVIRVEAAKREFTEPNAEVTCLIREMLADKEIEAMGLWQIVVMHEPIKDLGYPYLLCANRFHIGRYLHACCVGLYDEWGPGRGFAFAVSQSQH